MYRATEIKDGLLNVLGWRQNYNAADYTIASNLITTETGQYFQDIHPLLTLDNIKSIAPEFPVVTYSAWAVGTAYVIGAKVTVGRVNYQALIANTGKAPATNPAEWKVCDPFSDWLEDKTKSSIMNAVQTFISEKLEASTAKNILESKTLFDGAGRLTDLDLNTESIVGFEIVPMRSKGVTLRIEKIGLQFKGTGTIKLYLFHSSRPDVIQEISIERTRDSGMEWFAQTNLTLPYLSDDNDAGGSWYLCYDQKELPTGNASVFKGRDWSTGPCTTCSQSEYASWRSWSKFMEVHPFKAQASRASIEDDLTLWDISTNLYTYSTNYGINLQITMECDFTDIIIDQRKAFQNVIGLQVASDFIREFAYNPEYRINRTQQNFSRNELLYELDGDSTSLKKSGIGYKLSLAMKALQIDTMGMNRICLPCQNGGIKFRTI